MWLVVAAVTLGAFAEDGVRLASRVLLDRATFLSPQHLWRGPLLNLAVLVIPAMLVMALGPAARRANRLVILGSFFVAMEVLLLFPRVALWAAALLALGVAVSAGRMADRYASTILRLARALSIACVVVALSWGVGFNVWRYVAGNRAIAALPAAAPAAPSVILIVLDVVRAQSMGLYGEPAPTTPFLERFAASCVNYTRAIAPSSWTLPSHSTLFTGRWPTELSADWDVPLDDEYPTLAEHFSAGGYATGAAVANYLYTYYEFGLNRGFAHYDDYGISLGETGNRTVVGDRLARTWNQLTGGDWVPGRKRAGEVQEDIWGWIDRQDGRPVFVFLNWYDAHDPYDPPGEWREPFAMSEPPGRRTDPVDPAPGREVVNEEYRAYLGSIAHLDGELETLVAELERRDMLENTLLVITSDHGEEFQEHGLLRHGHTLYLPSIHVPLLICPPGGRAADLRPTVETPVSLRDVPQTILATTGLDLLGPRWPGYDLLALAEQGGTPTDERTACRSPAVSFVRRPPGEGPWMEGSSEVIRSVVEGRFHLIATDRGVEELYDIDTDPMEQQDLRSTPVADSVLPSLRAALDDPDPCGDSVAP